MKKELQSLKPLHFPSKLNKIYFFLGLVIFYLLSFFSPSRIIYFASYFVATFFFYKATNNIQKSLLFTLILALFSDVSFGKSLFIMEPVQLNLGAGFGFTPMTLLILCLLPFTIFRRIKQFHKADIFLPLFFILTFLSFYIFPYANVLYGIISLGEVILAYFILRTQLTETDFKNISLILVSLLIFQTLLGGLQFLIQRPIGQVAENVIIGNPYGITTPEDANLFRVTGTFSHPNFLASFFI